MCVGGGGDSGSRDSGCGGVDATCSEKIMPVVNLLNFNFQQHRKPATEICSERMERVAVGVSGGGSGC